MAVKAVAFVARGKTGKTTLIERLLPELASRGYRVGALKHDAHRFEIDYPGKDSHRLTSAGAETMLITSAEKLAIVKKHSRSPAAEDLIRTYFGDLDLVLVEGFRKSGLPKIEIHRKDRGDPLICRGEHRDPSLIAVASDGPVDADVPVLDLNTPVRIADFIVARLLKGEGERGGAD
jgi:molybdopterin-guanine dinucleotide biosynthesis protein MobB